MSENNMQIVKQFYAKFDAGDMPGLLDLLSEDVQWDHRGPAGVPYNRIYKSRAEVGEFFETFAETSETIAFEAREFFGSGDRVVALGFCHFKVIATGKEWEADWAMSYTVQDGLITHWRPMFDMGAEAAAFQA
jgi:ketosteroid isomerase-like protein